MQLKTNETGQLCEFMNKVAQNTGYRNRFVIKSLALRYLLVFILFVIGPPLLFCGGLIAGTLLYPFVPIAVTMTESTRWCRCAQRSKAL